MQGKGKHPLPLHPIPSIKWTRKCQVCARSKVSGMSPAVQLRVHRQRATRDCQKCQDWQKSPKLKTSSPKPLPLIDMDDTDQERFGASLTAERWGTAQVRVLAE